MKVVLLKDVKKIGRSYETVEVSDGFALNNLIPKKLAMPATGANMKVADVRKGKVVADRQMQDELIAQNIATLAEKTVTVKAKANEKNHLYDAVGESEIIAAAKETAGVDLPEGSVQLEKPIKELGSYDIAVSVGTVFGTFKLNVEAE